MDIHTPETHVICEQLVSTHLLHHAYPLHLQIRVLPCTSKAFQFHWGTLNSHEGRGPTQNLFFVHLHIQKHTCLQFTHPDAEHTNLDELQLQTWNTLLLHKPRSGNRQAEGICIRMSVTERPGIRGPQQSVGDTLWAGRAESMAHY